MKKTDPISAAHAYRQALSLILKSSTLQECRKHAARAIEWTFDKPEPGRISIASGYGHNTQQPFVEIGIANPTESANPIVQLTTDVARQQALYILEACDAAESDAFLVGWLGGQELTETQIGRLLADFRAYREQRRSGG